MKGIYSGRRHLKKIENLENTIELVEEFKKEIREEKIKQVERRREKGKERKLKLNLKVELFKRSELLVKYIQQRFCLNKIMEGLKINI